MACTIVEQDHVKAILCYVELVGYYIWMRQFWGGEATALVEVSLQLSEYLFVAASYKNIKMFFQE